MRRVVSGAVDLVIGAALGVALVAAPTVAGYLGGAFETYPTGPAVLAPVVETDETIRPLEEDSPLWDCRIDGNRICGPIEFGSVGETVRALVDNSPGR